MFDAARRIVQRAVDDGVFPAATAQVGSSTTVLWQDAFGHLTYDPRSPTTTLDTVFDLASLTKVLATTPLIMQMVECGGLGLDDRVQTIVPEFTSGAKDAVTIADLLSHTAGLPAYAPLFQRFRGREAFARAIASMPLAYEPGSRSIYSDLGFILLAIALERSSGRLLDDRFLALRHHMGITGRLQFRPPAQWTAFTAPTGIDQWRGRVLVGEVHDENAAALEGVAGHAGLFGEVGAVGEYARHVMQVLEGRVGAFRADTLACFISRRTRVPGSSRALGWDTMLPTSSCGTRMSPSAVGHTGFTGTSLWIDPGAGVYAVLLTNRVHPTRLDNRIAPVRRAFHDAVMEAI